jgi:DNA-binding response OmpR family regulator
MKKPNPLPNSGAPLKGKSTGPPSPASAPAAPAAAPAIPRPCILLVDDDDGVRNSLGDLLAEEGYRVLPASDGRQALDLIATTAVDLVLLDLNMPVKNGWDTFERLSAEHPLVPVAVITSRPNQLFTAVSAGVGALLEKPLDMPMLIRTIKRLLAESAEARLARLAGHETEFHYSAAQPE